MSSFLTLTKVSSFSTSVFKAIGSFLAAKSDVSTLVGCSNYFSVA